MNALDQRAGAVADPYHSDLYFTHYDLIELPGVA
jgi:hypothetical protein